MGPRAAKHVETRTHQQSLHLGLQEVGQVVCKGKDETASVLCHFRAPVSPPACRKSCLGTHGPTWLPREPGPVIRGHYPAHPLRPPEDDREARLLRFREMLLSNLVRTPELSQDILRPGPYRVQPVGALQASSCPPHTLRPPEILHWSRSFHDLPLSHPVQEEVYVLGDRQLQLRAGGAQQAHHLATTVHDACMKQKKLCPALRLLGTMVPLRIPLVQGDLLFVASLAAVALVGIVAISTSDPAKALAPEERSRNRMTRETIEPESDIFNTYNNKPQVRLNIAGGNILLDPVQGRAALTIAWNDAVGQALRSVLCHFWAPMSPPVQPVGTHYPPHHPDHRHHVRPPDQPPRLNRQVGLSGQLVEDDPSTVSPGAAGPRDLNETPQNTGFYFVCTSPVMSSKSDTVVTVGPDEEAVQHIADGVRGDTAAGITVFQVRRLLEPDKGGIVLCRFRAQIIPVVGPVGSAPGPLQSGRTTAMDTDNRGATTTSDLVFLTDRTCFPNATKCLGRRMPELKGEVVTGFVFSPEQLLPHVFLDATDHLGLQEVGQDVCKGKGETTSVLCHLRAPVSPPACRKSRLGTRGPTWLPRDPGPAIHGHYPAHPPDHRYGYSDHRVPMRGSRKSSDNKITNLTTMVTTRNILVPTQLSLANDQAAIPGSTLSPKGETSIGSGNKNGNLLNFSTNLTHLEQSDHPTMLCWSHGQELLFNDATDLVSGHDSTQLLFHVRQVPLQHGLSSSSSCPPRTLRPPEMQEQCLHDLPLGKHLFPHVSIIEADDSGTNDDDDCPEHGLSGPEIISELKGLTPEGESLITTFKDPPLSLFSSISGMYGPVMILYDTGNSHCLFCKDTPENLYGVRVKEGPQPLGAVGGTTLWDNNSWATMPLTTKGSREILIGIEVITADFPLVDIQESTAELKASKPLDTHLQSLSVPKTVGGKVDVLPTHLSSRLPLLDLTTAST